MTSNDQKISAVPSLMKWSYHACNKVQRDKFNEMGLSAVDLRDCCELLFQFIKLNTNNYNDPSFMEHDATLKMIKDEALVYGHVDCLSFAWELSGPWFEPYWYKGTACNRAARRGHLACLKYLHEVGCRWDSETCIQAAEGGHLDCLMYAHENGCPWDSRTSTSAAVNERLDCLRYAINNGLH